MNQLGVGLYDNFNVRPLELYGWNGDKPFISQVMHKYRPQVVIEVGTWKGLSARTMGFEMKSYTNAGKIYCVDTWLGNYEFWYSQDKEFDLKLINGYPSVYYNFLSNVKHWNLDSIIVPVPMPSNIAYKLFKERLNVSAKVVYVDGSHETEDVYKDLSSYINLVEPGGIIFGDDFNKESVKAAVFRYSYDTNRVYKVAEDNFWYFEV